MSIIFNLFKFVIILGIGIHVSFIYLLIQLGNKINKVDETTSEKQYCNIYNDNDYYLLCYALIIMCALLIYICFVVFTFKYDQIDWKEYDLFEVIENYSLQHNSNKIYIQRSFYVMKIIIGFIGYLSGKNTLYYFMYPNDSCKILYQFMAFGLLYLLISIKNYYKCCIGTALVIATIFAPRTMFYYFDRVLENREKNHQANKNENKKVIKIFVGVIPECCVCYEEDCLILVCGHLVCNACVPKLKTCPLCRSSTDVVQNYKKYKNSSNIETNKQFKHNSKL
jgi:hypothetical protein